MGDRLPNLSENVFVSQERVSGFPEKGADLRGSLGNLQGSLGNFRGTSGSLLSSTVRELPAKAGKTSGEVRGTSGECRDFPEARGSLTPSQRLAKFVSNDEGHPKAFPRPRQPLFAVPALRELESACRMSSL